MESMMSGMMGGSGGMMGSGVMMGGPGGMMGGSGGMMGGSGGMMGDAYAGMMGGSGMMGMGGGTAAAAKAKEKLTLLTRTDFLIQLVWQPLKPEDVPKTPEELKTKIDEEIKKMVEAQKNSEVRIPTPEEVEKASLAQSKVVENALLKVQQQAQAAAKTKGGTVPTAVAPAATAPAVVAPPATTPAK